MAATVTIGSGELEAEIALHGAELVGLRDEAGRDLLWDGDPAFWTGHAPLLFPIVGRLKDDRLRVGKVEYPMRQHGIARLSEFEVVAQEASACTLRFTSNEASLKAFPFSFVFEIAYRIIGRDLDMAVTVRNTGTVTMPASMGFHPALRWPLPYGGERAAHQVVFAEAEPEPIRRVAGGLLTPKPEPTPVEGRSLKLRDELFVADALIFLAPRSRSLRFGAPGARGIRVDYPSMPQLGLWTKPGADYLCIEPWCGYASPEGFDGEFGDKPGLVAIQAGGSHAFGMSIHLDPP